MTVITLDQMLEEIINTPVEPEAEGLIEKIDKIKDMLLIKSRFYRIDAEYQELLSENNNYRKLVRDFLWLNPSYEHFEECLQEARAILFMVQDGPVNIDDVFYAIRRIKRLGFKDKEEELYVFIKNNLKRFLENCESINDFYIRLNEFEEKCVGGTDLLTKNNDEKPRKNLLERICINLGGPFSTYYENKNREIVDGLVQSVIYINRQLKSVQEVYNGISKGKPIELCLDTTNFISYSLRIKELMAIERGLMEEITIYSDGYINPEDRQRLNETRTPFGLKDKDGIIKYANAYFDLIKKKREEGFDGDHRKSAKLHLALGVLLFKGLPFFSAELYTTVNLQRLYANLEKCSYALDSLQEVVQTGELLRNINQLKRLRYMTGTSDVTYKSDSGTTAMEINGDCLDFSLDMYLETLKSLSSQNQIRKREEYHH